MVSRRARWAFFTLTCMGSGPLDGPPAPASRVLSYNWRQQLAAGFQSNPEQTLSLCWAAGTGQPQAGARLGRLDRVGRCCLPG